MLAIRVLTPGGDGALSGTTVDLLAGRGSRLLVSGRDRTALESVAGVDYVENLVVTAAEGTPLAAMPAQQTLTVEWTLVWVQSKICCISDQ